MIILLVQVPNRCGNVSLPQYVRGRLREMIDGYDDILFAVYHLLVYVSSRVTSPRLHINKYIVSNAIMSQDISTSLLPQEHLIATNK